MLETPVTFSGGGPTLFFCGFSCGVWLEPIGVARLSLGGCLVGIAKGGRAEFSDIGGAAALLTGRAFGEAGIANPNRGTLFPEDDLPAPGIGGLSNGAGDAMSVRSGGSTVRFDCATLGSCTQAQGCRRRQEICLPSWTACYACPTTSLVFVFVVLVEMTRLLARLQKEFPQ